MSHEYGTDNALTHKYLTNRVQAIPFPRSLRPSSQASAATPRTFHVITRFFIDALVMRIPSRHHPTCVTSTDEFCYAIHSYTSRKVVVAQRQPMKQTGPIYEQHWIMNSAVIKIFWHSRNHRDRWTCRGQNAGWAASKQHSRSSTAHYPADKVAWERLRALENPSSTSVSNTTRWSAIVIFILAVQRRVVLVSGWAKTEARFRKQGFPVISPWNTAFPLYRPTPLQGIRRFLPEHDVWRRQVRDFLKVKSILLMIILGTTLIQLYVTSNVLSVVDLWGCFHVFHCN